MTKQKFDKTIMQKNITFIDSDNFTINLFKKQTITYIHSLQSLLNLNNYLLLKYQRGNKTHNK
jgi:hypothetical protein